MILEESLWVLVFGGRYLGAGLWLLVFGLSKKVFGFWSLVFGEDLEENFKIIRKINERLKPKD
jgi:hypothetical protein